MSRVFRLLILVACAFILAACSGGASTPNPTATRSKATATTIPPASCPRAMLENWLARSNSLVSEFSSVVNSSLTTPRDQAAMILDKVSALQSALNAVLAPDCAADHRRLIEEMMNKVISTFTDYANGQSVDMPAFIPDFNNQVNKIKDKEAELNTIYKTLH